MRRARVRATVAAVAVVGALVAGGCGGGTDDPARIVRAAATKTASAQSSRMALTVDAKGGAPSGIGTVTAEGTFDYGSRRGRMTMELASMGTLEAIVDGAVLYMKFPPELAANIAGGKPWVKIDVEAVGRQAGIDGSGLGPLDQGDPTQALQYLRGASDDVTKVGEEDVRGAPTTHYRATLDLEKAAASLSGAARKSYDEAVARLGTAELPADVWIDEEGRARRMVFEREKVAVTMELFDFGVAVDAAPPPSDQVVDVGVLLGGGGGQAG